MRKSDKKLDNQIIKALTDVCEVALKDYSGFQWITHLVNYDQFPKSLKVICIFDTNDSLKQFTAANGRDDCCRLITRALFEIHVDINGSQITADTEENCSVSHNGKWAERLVKQFGEY